MKDSRGDIIFTLVNGFIVTSFFIIVLYPLIFVVSASISNPSLVIAGKVFLFPREITFEAYKRILEYEDIWTGYRNTIFYALSGTFVSLAVTLTAAYSLSRRDLIGKNIFVVFFTITMFFSGGLIPTYMLISNIGLKNTVFVQILMGAGSFFNIVVARTFYQTTIPVELQESALIDGCSNFKLFYSIILPLSKPIIAVIALYCGVAQWNSFFTALIYISDRKLFPLQLILREILVVNQINMQMLQDEGAAEYMQKRIELAALLKYALIIVASLPVIIVYPFLQKYFVKGMMIGALKG